MSLVDDQTALLARSLCGIGMRLKESACLRVKDVEFDRHHAIIVREAKATRPALSCYRVRWRRI